MSVKDDFFNTTVSRDFFSAICGDLVGGGSCREVYACKFDESIVIKVEYRAHSFQNVKEHMTWQEVMFTSLSEWFAPVLSISPCGSVLVMKRTSQIRKEELPDKVPSLFTDLKASNWGIIDGKPVCHDYGFSLSNFSLKKMRKPDWEDVLT